MAAGLAPLTQTKAVSERDANHPYDQMLTVTVGPYTPKNISFTNWNNNSFDYSDQTRSTFLAELGWSIQLFEVGPTSLYFSEGLAFSTMSLKLAPNLLSNPAPGTSSVTFHMFGFDSRLMQAWETCPLEALVPYWDFGVQYTLYNQSGASDLVAGEGSASNLVAGLGLRYWVNRSSSISREYPGHYKSIPIFLTAKFNRIFSNSAGFDPAGSTVVGGLSVGL
jgi:hypothetical protein